MLAEPHRTNSLPGLAYAVHFGTCSFLFGKREPLLFRIQSVGVWVATLVCSTRLVGGGCNEKLAALPTTLTTLRPECSAVNSRGTTPGRR